MKTILYTYKEYLKSNNKLHFNSYENLHNWSINEISDFWKSIVDFFDIEFDKPPTSIYKFNKDFFKSQWFNDSKISYSQNVFKNENLTENLSNLNEDFKKSDLVLEVIKFLEKDKKRPICTPFSK